MATAPQNKAPKTGKIVVGCKLPHGLHLDIGQERVTLKGANDAEIIGGHGITHNVDAQFFARWIELNHAHPAVQNGLIFAHGNTADAKAEAKEREKVKTGFEGVDPEKPGPGLEKAETPKG